jgi:hypothetical protein
MARFPECQARRRPYPTIKKIAACARNYWANALFHAESGQKSTVSREMDAWDARRDRLGRAPHSRARNTFATGWCRSLNASGIPEPSSGRRYMRKASVTSVPLVLQIVHYQKNSCLRTSLLGQNRIQCLNRLKN